MTRYNYTLETEFGMNPETGIEEVIASVVTKSVKETYPDMDILQRGLKNGRQTKTIQKGLLKATQGQAEAFLVQQEEEWFKAQDEMQQAEKELRTLEEVLVVEKEAVEAGEASDEVGSDELANLKYAVETTEKRIKELAGYTQNELAFNPSTGKEEQKEVHYPGIIEKAQEVRDAKEAQFEWLKAYRGEETEAVRPEPAADVKISPDDVKKLIAHERDSKVRNSEDTLADLAKMNSLLFSTVGSIYGTLTSTAKDKIDADTRAIIEYSIAKFADTQTRADRQLAEEGTDLVDKLFAREVQIADIIDELK